MDDIEKYEQENYWNLPKNWNEWTELQKIIHIICTSGRNKDAANFEKMLT